MGLIEVASDIIYGLYEETPYGFYETDECNWETYDIEPSP